MIDMSTPERISLNPAEAKHLIHQAVQCRFTLICKDHTRDNEGGWSWMAVIRPDKMPEGDQLSEDYIAEVYRFLEDQGIRIRSAGNSGAGGPFANEPWLWCFSEIIIVSQNGGLDI